MRALSITSPEVARRIEHVQVSDLVTTQGARVCLAGEPVDAVELDGCRLSSLPVVTNWRVRRLLGEVSVEELRARLASGADATLEGLVRSPRICFPDETPEAALAIMRARRCTTLHVADAGHIWLGSIDLETLRSVARP